MCLPQFRHPLFIHSPRLIMRWVQNRYSNLVKQWHEPDGPAYSMMDTQYETSSKKLLVICKKKSYRRQPLVLDSVIRDFYRKGWYVLAYNSLQPGSSSPRLRRNPVPVSYAAPLHRVEWEIVLFRWSVLQPSWPSRPSPVTVLRSHPEYESNMLFWNASNFTIRRG